VPRIVAHAYRPKRPPRKRAADVILALVTASVLAAGTTRPAAAYSAYYTGNELLHVCDNPNLRVVCQGYIAGVAAVAQFLSDDDHPFAGWRLCVPMTTVPTRQLADVVIQRLRASPEHNHLAAASLLWLRRWPRHFLAPR
jgi:hypothetical protein